MNIILLIIAVCIVLAILWILLSRKKVEDKPVAAYVCDQCGESHCDCHLEEEKDPAERQ